LFLLLLQPADLGDIDGVLYRTGTGGWTRDRRGARRG
jgi:hypothetical protein